MCTVKELQREIKSALKENNEYRNKQLQTKLDEQYIKISGLIDTTIEKRAEHLKTSPETSKSLHKMQENCIRNTTNFSNLMNEIRSDVHEIKESIKEMKTNYVTKDEFNPYRKKIDRLMDIGLGILLACGIIVAYYILIQAGLPTP